MHPFAPAPRDRGFTVVELLVAVALVALLVSVLLPALAGARAAGESAVCMGHLREAVHGMAAYVADQRGYMPGPNTSGYAASRAGSGYNPGSDPAAPIHNGDWMSPTLHDSLALPGDRWDRLAELFNTKFRCPSNDAKYAGYHQGTHRKGDWNGFDTTNLHVASYASPMGLHVFGRYQSSDNAKVYGPSWLSGSSGILQFPDTRLTFKLHAVGPAADKVWALDGARYVYYTNAGAARPGDIDFWAENTGDHYSGGNIMNWSPAVTSTYAYNSFNASPYKPAVYGSDVPHDYALRYGYRHTGQLNAAFLDGSVRQLTFDQGRRIDQYYPAGTRVNRAADTDDPSDYNGYIIR